MKSITAIAFLLIVNWQVAIAQTPLAKNALFAELSGWGYATINYERAVWQQGKHQLGLRAGLFGIPTTVGQSMGPFPSYTRMSWSGALGANYVRGTGNHHLELSLTYTFLRYHLLAGSREWETLYDPFQEVALYDDSYVEWKQYHFLSARVGYRYQKPNGGLVFRAGITPVTQFLSSFQDYTLGMGLLAPARSGAATIFLPVPDLSIGWRF
ncbi:MAG: hypothetical protein MUC97_05410 [Bernardetiaceae bacterium]|jgi:hypothetical protein|nr:hypothetical protein [Bernardetiaceae bacterium]